jgi:hypothetical protein
VKVVYLPLFRTAVSYDVSVGRRWSVLEQMILIELAQNHRSLNELGQMSALPNRIVIEALIRLLRANWVELRASGDNLLFAATNAGKRRSLDEHLPAQLERDTKWMSFCFDRVTGSWLRSEDLTLVYDRDLPHDAALMSPVNTTYDPKDGNLRDLIILHPDESLEPEEPRFKTPSRPYARLTLSFDQLEGLPPYAPLRLVQAVREFAMEGPDEFLGAATPTPDASVGEMRDNFTKDDFIVGGEAHFDTVRAALQNASTTVIIHSCFVHPAVLEKLRPDLESAAKRNVKVELLWGLNKDPESNENPEPIRECEKVLDKILGVARTRIRMSPISSGSHAKMILYDDRELGCWISVVGSCNFLSTWYDAIDVSVRSRSARLATKLLGWLTAAQQPSIGSWSPTARRLNRLWIAAKITSAMRQEKGAHKLVILSDADHYACVRMARDTAKTDIIVACDLYGLAAETTALVPLTRASEDGKVIKLFYQRASRLLKAEGRDPKAEDMAKRGLSLTTLPKLHGKFLVWDRDAIAITSFNWLSTVVEGSRSNGAELGVLISGENIRSLLRDGFAGLQDAAPMKAALD